MIKINRNIQSQKIEYAREKLKSEKSKNNGSYNTKEVLEALKEVFSKKCYICENKTITTYNIEHFKPHKDTDKELKFDFDNLFLSCGHCNNIKLGNYENLLDCSKVDVDEFISFRKIGEMSYNEIIEIESIEGAPNTEAINETVDLLNKVYNGTTEMKKLECINIRRELRKEIINFKNILNEYWETDGEDKEDTKFLIIRELKASSAFTAFKRWIIRDNKEYFPEFLQDDSLKIKI